MRKSKILYASLIFIILQLFIFIGVAVWIIPYQHNIGISENLNGLWEKHLGGQSVVFTDSRVLPTSTNLEVVNPSGYTVSYRLINETKFTNGSPIDPGTYIIQYTNGTNVYEVTFTILPAESSSNVAFIPGTLGNSSTYVYYTSVETALSAASNGQSVYVIPGTNPIIKTNCEVKKGVKLCLPYEMPDGSGISSTNGEDNSKLCTILHVLGQTNDFFPSHTDPTLLTNEVKVADNVKIINNGDIYIGGNVSSGFIWNYSGLVGNYGYTDPDGSSETMSSIGKDGVANGTPFKGYYAQITLGYNSKIESTGYIECNGYIVGNYTESSSGEVIHNSEVRILSGEIRIPFITPENRQGSRFAILAGGILKYAGGALFGGDNIELSFDATPFNRFYFQNCATRLRIDYGGVLTGYINLYANNQDNTEKAIFVGSSTNSTIQLKEGSYFVGSTTQNTNKDKDYGASKIELDVYGGANLNDLTMTITANLPGLGTKYCKVSTKGVYFPVSWYYDVRLHKNTETNQTSASYKFNSMVKIMPGASLLIDEGATLECGNLVIYDESYNEEKLGMDLIDMGAKDYYPGDKGPGSLTVNGTIIANNTGGLYLTENTNAIAQIKTSTTITSKEWTVIDEGKAWSATSATAKTTSFGYNLQMYLYSDKLLHKSGLGKGTYFSKQGYWDTSSNVSSYTIAYNADGKVDNPSSRIIASGTTNYRLTSADLPVLSAYHYNFIGWYDSNGNQLKVGDIISSNITLNARWQAITYNLNYVITTADGIIKPEVPNPNNLTFTIETMPTLLDLEDENYVINGWFLENDFTGKKLSTLSPECFDYLIDDTITLYTKWIHPILKKYNITMIVVDKNGDELKNITVSDFTANKTGIAYFNPFDNHGLSYTLQDVNSNKAKNYLDSWYNADYSSGDHKFTYADQYKCDLNDKGEIIFEGEDGQSFVIYAKQLTKYTVTYDDGEEYYDSEFTTRDLEPGSDYILRWSDSSGKLYLGNSTHILTKDISLQIKKYYKVTISERDQGGVVKITADDPCILTSINAVKLANSIENLTGNDYVYVLEGSTIKGTATSYGGDNSQSVTITDDSWVINKAKTITVSSSCIVSGSLLILADGTKKKVEDLTLDDKLLVFNHETGQFESSTIVFIDDDGWKEYNVINLVFSNGTITRLIYEHGYFDLTLNKYVYITEVNYRDYIGHDFVITDGTNISSVKLIDSYITNEYVGCYSPVTAVHLNYIVDGLLSMPGGIEGIFNIFEYGEGLKFDEELMKEDIEKYGIMEYEVLAEYVPYEMYYAFNAKYFNVAIGKGLITFDEILYYAEKYLNKHGLLD